MSRFLLLKAHKLPAITLICVISLWHRKYLRDADRQVLAQQAFVLTVKVLEDTLNDLTQVRLRSEAEGLGHYHLFLIPFVYM